MKKIIILISLLIITCGCDKQYSEPNIGETTFEGPVNFFANDICDNIISRGSITSASNIDNFGLLAYYIENGKDFANTTPDFMYNVRAIKTDGGAWTYSPEKFWPRGFGYEMKFFTYSPCDSVLGDNFKLSPESQTGYPSFKYKVSEDITEQHDLLFSSASSIKQGDVVGGSVQLRFDHILTKVSFSIIGNPMYRLKSVRIEGVCTEGTYQYSNDLNKYTWNSLQPGDFTATIGDELIDKEPTLSSSSVTASDGYLFMIPQTLPAGAKIVVTLTNADGTAKEKEYNVQGAKWGEGATMNYTIKLRGYGEELQLEDFTNMTGYPSGDTWVITDTVTGANWWNLKDKVDKANADGIKVNLEFPNLEEFDGDNILYDCGAFSISAPNATKIKGGFFQDCDNLVDVYMPNLEDLGNNAFYGCDSLETIELPALEIVGSQAFQDCDKLKTVILPNVEEIQQTAFSNCDVLEMVSCDLAESVGVGAFEFCPNLEIVNLPKVTDLAATAFNGCTDLTKVTLDELKILKDGTFQNFANLKEIYLPSVTDIGNNAFYGCPNLITMTLATNEGVKLSSVENLFAWDFYKTTLTIGSQNASYINGGNNILNVNGSENNFKDIIQVPN